MTSLRILIADDHDVVRQGVRTLLGCRSEWKICGEATTGREAIEKTRKLRPDLVLLDITMPGLDGLQAMPHILKASPSVQILVFTMHDSGEMATKVLAAGASGLVLKSDAGRDLVLAAQAIENNKPFLSPAVTKIMLAQLVNTSSPGPSPADLTARELEILKLLAQGRANRQVAAALRLARRPSARIEPISCVNSTSGPTAISFISPSGTRSSSSKRAFAVATADVRQRRTIFSN
jgi:DNA-binding NarL/FixJ family response regulator